MKWLTTRTGNASHPVCPDLSESEWENAGVVAECGAYGSGYDGDNYTDAPLKRPCRRPACKRVAEAQHTADYNNGEWTPACVRAAREEKAYTMTIPELLQWHRDLARWARRREALAQSSEGSIAFREDAERHEAAVALLETLCLPLPTTVTPTDDGRETPAQAVADLQASIEAQGYSVELTPEEEARAKELQRSPEFWEAVNGDGFTDTEDAGKGELP